MHAMTADCQLPSTRSDSVRPVLGGFNRSSQHAITSRSVGASAVGALYLSFACRHRNTATLNSMPIHVAMPDLARTCG